MIAINERVILAAADVCQRNTLEEMFGYGVSTAR